MEKTEKLLWIIFDKRKKNSEHGIEYKCVIKSPLRRVKHTSTGNISNTVDNAEIIRVKPQCVSCKTGNMEQEITSWENLFHGSLTDYLRKHEADHFDGTLSSSNTKGNSSIRNADGPPNLQKSWKSIDNNFL